MNQGPFRFPPSNAAVEPVRPGWSVLDEANFRWMVAPPTLGTHAQWGAVADAYVFDSLKMAAHHLLEGRAVTTVPRFNGYCYEWAEIE